jgi:hypothetical protein
MDPFFPEQAPVDQFITVKDASGRDHVYRHVGPVQADQTYTIPSTSSEFAWPGSNDPDLPGWSAIDHVINRGRGRVYLRTTKNNLHTVVQEGSGHLESGHAFGVSKNLQVTCSGTGNIGLNIETNHLWLTMNSGCGMVYNLEVPRASFADQRSTIYVTANEGCNTAAIRYSSCDIAVTGPDYNQIRLQRMH